MSKCKKYIINSNFRAWFTFDILKMDMVYQNENDQIYKTNRIDYENISYFNYKLLITEKYDVKI